MKKNQTIYQQKSGLLTLFDEHNSELEREVLKGKISKSTLTKYRTIRNRVAEYIDTSYQQVDLEFSSVPYSFCNDLHFYLVFKHKLTHNTGVTYIEMLEKIFRIAVDDNLINEKQKPTYSYRKRKFSSSNYLTIDELYNLEELRGHPDIKKEIHLLFLFSCYTGVTFTEIQHINTEDIVDGDSEEDLWLAAEGIEHWEIRYVPLFIEAEDIIDMFEEKRNEMNSELLFPIEPEYDIEEELSNIAQIAGIQRPISFLTAVNTFYFSYSQDMNFPENSYEGLIPHYYPLQSELAYRNIIE